MIEVARFIIVFAIAAVLLYAAVMFLIVPRDDRKEVPVKPSKTRDPNDWRTQARGGWRELEAGDLCVDTLGREYTVRVIDSKHPDFSTPSFGCMSVDHSDGTITAHYKTGRDSRWEETARDLVRIVKRG